MELPTGERVTRRFELGAADGSARLHRFVRWALVQSALRAVQVSPFPRTRASEAKPLLALRVRFRSLTVCCTGWRWWDGSAGSAGRGMDGRGEFRPCCSGRGADDAGGGWADTAGEADRAAEAQLRQRPSSSPPDLVLLCVMEEW